MPGNWISIRISAGCFSRAMVNPVSALARKFEGTGLGLAMVKQLTDLLKNFGVTRHGRVVFYDYDEICFLTEANFRHIPAPRTPEDEMASEPWYSIGPLDVFPEEFPPFLFADAGQRKLFDELHGELYNADYWKGLQDAIRAGKVIDVFPYRRRDPV